VSYYDATAEDLHALVDRNLTNHPPVSDAVVGRFEALRTLAKAYAHAVVDICPVSAERTLAIRFLEQSVMWSVASIARNQEIASTGVEVEG